MGRSSLMGVERADLEPIGRDVATLGPSDTSDSGSDMAGIDDQDRNDPTEPVDAALNADVPRTWASEGSDSGTGDASGTGERRAAGNDGGGREAADISVDRVFDPNAESEDDLDEDEDPDLAFVDQAIAQDVLDEETSTELGPGEAEDAVQGVNEKDA